ncbi:hypothetical protein [Nocardioides sp. LHG3406-4]|uniref:hypothetical protein n=1 Tax=Nocardioides sp. LHG3406-4 TaxID=2804575 RepID=UPI003CF8FB3A
MTRRRLAPLLVSALLVGSLVGCSRHDEGNRPAGAVVVALREPERTQVIDGHSVLQPCTAEAASDETDGTDAVATRVASIVVPVAYRVDPFPQDLPAATLEGDDAARYLPTCAFIVGRGIDSLRVKGRDVFEVTIPARQSLRAALPHLASQDAPHSVEDDVRVLSGRAGERATYRLRVPGIGAYDVVALQADGVRLTWLAPVGRRPTEERDASRLWRDVQASLAVRSPAAGDGDPDARSDEVMPQEPTYEAIKFGPVTTGPPPTGYRRASCAGPRGHRSAIVTFWAPERLTSGRTCSLSRQRPLQAELERLTVSADVDAPLRDAYESEKRFEADGGDDATSDLEYDGDVPGPGGLRAESLVFTAFNDGSPKETHVVQAGGVRVSWPVLPGGWGPQAGELMMVLESMKVSRG